MGDHANKVDQIRTSKQYAYGGIDKYCQDKGLSLGEKVSKYSKLMIEDKASNIKFYIYDYTDIFTLSEIKQWLNNNNVRLETEHLSTELLNLLVLTLALLPKNNYEGITISSKKFWFGSSDALYSPTDNRIVFNENAFKLNGQGYSHFTHVLVHELAHVWDDSSPHQGFYRINWTKDPVSSCLGCFLVPSFLNEYTYKKEGEKRDFATDYAKAGRKEDYCETVASLYWGAKEIVLKAVNNLTKHKDADLADKINLAYDFYGKMPDDANWIIRTSKNLYRYSIDGTITEVDLRGPEILIKKPENIASPFYSRDTRSY